MDCAKSDYAEACLNALSQPSLLPSAFATLRRDKREKENRSCPLEFSCNRICRMVNRITENVLGKILSPGERKQVRASVKHKLN